MWSRFWFRAETGAQGAARGVEPWDFDRAPALPVSVPAAAEPASDEAAEAAAFLERVYTHQQC